MRNHFSRQKKKTKHGQITQFLKKHNKKGNRENEVFFDGKEKTEKEIWAEA